MGEKADSVTDMHVTGSGTWSYRTDGMAAVMDGPLGQAPVAELRTEVRNRLRAGIPRAWVGTARRAELLAVLASIESARIQDEARHAAAKRARRAEQAHAQRVNNGTARWARKGDRVRHLLTGTHATVTDVMQNPGQAPPDLDIATQADEEFYGCPGGLWEVLPPELTVTGCEEPNPFTDGACYEISDIAGGVPWIQGHAYTNADGSFNDHWTRKPSSAAPDPETLALWKRAVDEYRARTDAAPASQPHQETWRELPGGQFQRDLADGGYLLVSRDGVGTGWRWQQVPIAGASQQGVPVAPSARGDGLPSARSACDQADLRAYRARREVLAEVRADELDRIEAGHRLTARPGAPEFGGVATWEVTDADDDSWAMHLICTENELREIFRGGHLSFSGHTPEAPVPPRHAGKGYRPGPARQRGTSGRLSH